MDIINKIKEKLFLLKEKIFAFLNSLYNEIKSIENKKRFAIIVGSWIIVFISIIVVSKIKDRHDENFRVRALAETESIEETTLADIYAESVIAKKETMIETSVEETKIQTTEVESREIEEVVNERETIAFEKIEVVEEQLYDDAIVSTQKTEIIYSEPGEKKSSKELDEDRFVNCIDVSKHQGDIDWKSVKESGIDYAIIRVAYRGYETGKIAKDSKFEKNIKGALANDIKVGVYFFSQATNKQEALEEASVILKYIKGYDITLPVVIDWETAPGYRTYSGISKSELTEIITVFCDTVDKYGYDPMVYMCQTDFTGRVNGKELSKKYNIWVAWYFGCYAKTNKSLNWFKYGDEIPDLTYDYDVWQYSKNGYVKGISTPVDMNVYILPEKKPNPEFMLKDKNIIIDYNDKKYDILSGVKLIDSDGLDITNKVKYMLKDIQSKPVTLEEAILNPGKYSITYYYEDNPKVLVDIDLYVRDLPKVYFDGTEWKHNEIKNIDYLYNAEFSTEENLEMLKVQILSKIETRAYDLLQDSDYNVIIGDIDNIENLVVGKKISDGEYDLKYSVKCFENLIIERKIKLKISTPTITENETNNSKENEENVENVENEENKEISSEITDESEEKIFDKSESVSLPMT